MNFYFGRIFDNLCTMAKNLKEKLGHGHHHRHEEVDDDKVENRILNYLKTFKHQIMGALEDLKAKYETANQKIDILQTGVTGVKKDVAFIKKKLEDNAGGLDAAGVAELLGIADATNEKLSSAADEITALDAETNSEEEPV